MVAEVPLGPIFDAFSVPATVTPPDAAAIATTGVWVTSTTESRPGFGDLQRREPVRVLALKRADVGSVPRGTVILAPETADGVVLRWRVDGFGVLEADCVRVVVVPVPEDEPEPTSWIQPGWFQ